VSNGVELLSNGLRALESSKERPGVHEREKEGKEEREKTEKKRALELRRSSSPISGVPLVL
jgi:hypothetical protein